MRVTISAEGEHQPAGRHYMTVDNHGILADLSKVTGTLVDPTITRVEWGLLSRGGENREGGTITRQDGTKQTFFDKGLLAPYLAAFRQQLQAHMDAYERAIATTMMVSVTAGTPVLPAN